jgi:hypothetical protein
LKYLYRIWRTKNRESDPRKWSNDELRKFAGLFHESIINVSAGKDKDKEGNFYKDYFTAARSYTISNYKKMSTNSNELEIDLSIPIPKNSELISSFDVVFTHTVLEHIYDIFTSIKNLCYLSKDIIITVVPFLQAFHHDEGVFNDHWRLTPYSLIRLFREHNFKTIYISWNNDPLGNIYLFSIASKNPEKWAHIREKGQYQQLQGPGYFRQKVLSNVDSCPAIMINDLEV